MTTPKTATPDIVDRLRHHAEWVEPDFDLVEPNVLLAAADEIERLRRCDVQNVYGALPADLPADVIAAVVGGGITSEQVRQVWGLIRAALQLRDMTGSALSSADRGRE